MILLLLTLIPCTYAEDETTLGAYNITINPQYVQATGICSCSLMTDRKYHNTIFRNYCPYCKRTGTLKYEVGSSAYTSPA